MDLFSDPARIASFRFTQPCLDIEQIYHQPRGVNDELSFFIPSDHPRSSRTVKVQDSLYELWSPNCSTTDYYSGAPGQLALASETIPLPFADGRLGPQDWSLHPQHFSRQAPWLGFCRVAPFAAVDWSAVDAELVPLAAVWQHSLSRPGYGRLDDSYANRLGTRAHCLGSAVAKYTFPWGLRDNQLQHVLRDRPIYPPPDLMKFLCSGIYWVWQDLVNLLTAAQRGLREMEAWLTMMEHWERRLERNTEIPAVRADRIGVWINGASEDEGLWLLRIGVIPVYVIHQYVTDVDFSVSLPHIPDRRPKNFYSTFLESTQAERLNTVDWNSYLKAFHSRGPGNTLPFSPSQLQRDPGMDFGCRGCIRSSSWAFSIKDRRQPRPVNFRGGSSSRQDEPHRESTVAHSAVGSDNDQRAAKLVTEGQVSFWQPPPVVYGPESRAPAIKNTKRGRKKNKNKNKTSWIYFYESDEPGMPVPEGHTAMVLKSKRSGEESDLDEDSEPECGPSTFGRSRTYWDRHRHRRLTFLQPLPRNAQVSYDASLYGIPLPDIPYLINEGNFKFSQQSKSTWAYFDPHPKSRSLVGSVPPIEECRPHPPFLSGVPSVIPPKLSASSPISAPGIPMEVDATFGDRDREEISATAPTCLEVDHAMLDMTCHSDAPENEIPPPAVNVEQPMSLDGDVAVTQEHPESHKIISTTLYKAETAPMVTSETKDDGVRLELNDAFEAPDEQLDWGIDYDEDGAAVPAKATTTTTMDSAPLLTPANNPPSTVDYVINGNGVVAKEALSMEDTDAPPPTMMLTMMENIGLSASATGSSPNADYPDMIVDGMAAGEEALSANDTDVAGISVQQDGILSENEPAMLDDGGAGDLEVGRPDAAVGIPVQHPCVRDQSEHDFKVSMLGNGGESDVIRGLRNGSTTKLLSEASGETEGLSHLIFLLLLAHLLIPRLP